MGARCPSLDSEVRFAAFCFFAKQTREMKRSRAHTHNIIENVHATTTSNNTNDNRKFSSGRATAGMMVRARISSLSLSLSISLDWRLLILSTKIKIKHAVLCVSTCAIQTYVAHLSVTDARTVTLYCSRATSGARVFALIVRFAFERRAQSIDVALLSFRLRRASWFHYEFSDIVD